MSKRKFKINNPKLAESCPKCQNSTEFEVVNRQFSEDCCEIYLECKCGFDPTFDDTSSRFEDVWGGLGEDEIIMALAVWNELVLTNYKNAEA